LSKTNTIIIAAFPIVVDNGPRTEHVLPASELERGLNLVVNRFLDFPVGIPDLSSIIIATPPKLDARRARIGS
jgi:hypothetical protein